jgi:hypothetical protein
MGGNTMLQLEVDYLAYQIVIWDFHGFPPIYPPVISSMAGWKITHLLK